VWTLSCTQAATGHELELVKVDQRINDLSVNVFDTTASLHDQRAMDRVVPLNPLGVLSVELIQGKGGIPSQTKLLPEHVTEIIEHLKLMKAEIGDAEFSAAIDALDFSKQVVGNKRE
jgi:hypothetical protein